MAGAAVGDFSIDHPPAPWVATASFHLCIALGGMEPGAESGSENACRLDPMSSLLSSRFVRTVSFWDAERSTDSIVSFCRNGEGVLGFSDRHQSSEHMAWRPVKSLPRAVMFGNSVSPTPSRLHPHTEF